MGAKKDKIYVLLQVILMIGWWFEVEAMEFEIPRNLHQLGLFAAALGAVLLIVALFQIRRSLSPFPSPRQGAKLITTGAFAFCRHPIYSGILFLAFGASIWLGSGYKLLISLLLYLLFFLKSRYEERLLSKAFPEYVEYRKNTGRFFPKFSGRI